MFQAERSADVGPLRLDVTLPAEGTRARVARRHLRRRAPSPHDRDSLGHASLMGKGWANHISALGVGDKRNKRTLSWQSSSHRPEFAPGAQGLLDSRLRGNDEDKESLNRRVGKAKRAHGHTLRVGNGAPLPSLRSVYVAVTASRPFGADSRRSRAVSRSGFSNEGVFRTFDSGERTERPSK